MIDALFYSMKWTSCEKTVTLQEYWKLPQRFS